MDFIKWINDKQGVKRDNMKSLVLLFTIIVSVIFLPYCSKPDNQKFNDLKIKNKILRSKIKLIDTGMLKTYKYEGFLDGANLKKGEIYSKTPITKKVNFLTEVSEFGGHHT